MKYIENLLQNCLRTLLRKKRIGSTDTLPKNSSWSCLGRNDLGSCSGFTLIETVVATALIAIIGMTLIKLSTANIEGVEYSKTKRYDLYSLVLFRVAKMGDIRDYSKIENIKVPSAKTDIKNQEMLELKYELKRSGVKMSDDTHIDINDTITLNLYKEIIDINGSKVEYYRFR